MGKTISGFTNDGERTAYNNIDKHFTSLDLNENDRHKILDHMIENMKKSKGADVSFRENFYNQKRMKEIKSPSEIKIPKKNHEAHKEFIMNLLMQVELKRGE